MANLVKKITDIDFEKEASGVLESWKDESLASLQLGFTFASALAWNEVMKSIVRRFVKNGKSSIAQTSLFAFAVTFVAGIIMYVMKKTKFTTTQPKRVQLT